MRPEAIADVLIKHATWTRGESGGARADLRDANLRGADLKPIRDDFFEVLTHARGEAPALLAALENGHVNGSAYQGECACLIGTIANVRGVNYRKIDGLMPNSSRPAERFFLAISTGDTPATNPVAAIAAECTREFIAGNPAEVPANG